MGIHFVCHHCGFALHVKDFQAGKRGKCPSCSGSFRIPNGDASYSSPTEEPSDSSAVSNLQPAIDQVKKGKVFEREGDSSSAIAIDLEPSNRLPVAFQENANAKWLVRPPSGGQFGPANADLLASWINESRVTPDSLLCREGSSHWQVASSLLPELFPGKVVASAGTYSDIGATSGGKAPTMIPDASLNISTAVHPAATNVADPAAFRSGAILRKKMQKRRQQLTIVILLAAVSLVLFAILIYVLFVQVGNPAVPAKSAFQA